MHKMYSMYVRTYILYVCACVHIYICARDVADATVSRNPPMLDSSEMENLSLSLSGAWKGTCLSMPCTELILCMCTRTYVCVCGQH